VLASALSMILIKGQWGEILFALEVITVLAMEFKIFRTQQGIVYKNFISALGIFAVAFTIWSLDVKEILCIKDNHVFQGHALWHILNSLCFIFLYKFYRQFKKE
jgi:hypothetical protein